jgi:hypothetical protein
MTSAVSTRDLERELKAAELVRAQVSDLADDDLALIRDSVEGQTSLFEIMAAMAEADGEDAALVEGVAAYIKKLHDRQKRIENRMEIRRALMANALDVAELPRLVTAAGTITRKALPDRRRRGRHSGVLLRAAGAETRPGGAAESAQRARRRYR